MIGTGCNPNVAAVIVIGIEPKWTKKIVDGIAKTGKPVEGFHIERTGDIGTTMKASKKAQEFVMWASEKQREECPMSVTSRICTPDPSAIRFLLAPAMILGTRLSSLVMDKIMAS